MLVHAAAPSVDASEPSAVCELICAISSTGVVLFECMQCQPVQRAGPCCPHYSTYSRSGLPVPCSSRALAAWVAELEYALPTHAARVAASQQLAAPPPPLISRLLRQVKLRQWAMGCHLLLLLGRRTSVQPCSVWFWSVCHNSDIVS